MSWSTITTTASAITASSTAAAAATTIQAKAATGDVEMFNLFGSIQEAYLEAPGKQAGALAGRCVSGRPKASRMASASGLSSHLLMPTLALTQLLSSYSSGCLPLLLGPFLFGFNEPSPPSVAMETGRGEQEASGSL